MKAESASFCLSMLEKTEFHTLEKLYLHRKHCMGHFSSVQRSVFFYMGREKEAQWTFFHRKYGVTHPLQSLSLSFPPLFESAASQKLKTFTHGPFDGYFSLKNGASILPIGLEVWDWEHIPHEGIFCLKLLLT